MDILLMKKKVVATMTALIVSMIDNSVALTAILGEQNVVIMKFLKHASFKHLAYKTMTCVMKSKDAIAISPTLLASIHII
jgi:predicted transcriptional regulator